MAKSSTSTHTMSVNVKMPKESKKYSTSFEMMTRAGFKGDMSSTSILPCSFSRTMETLVIIAQISIKISPSKPGTKLGADLPCGLKSIVVEIFMGEFWLVKL